MKRAAQSLVFLVCVLFSVAAIYNVASDNAEVEGRAKEIACGPAPAEPAVGPKNRAAPAVPACNAQLTQMSRTPLAQTFVYATSRRSVEVRCTRALIFVGDYACALR
jgi:hypothetical protein